jgi:hypothetical protein
VCDITSVYVGGQVMCFPVREEWKDRFSLVPEDYLHGVITVINELVRTHPSSLYMRIHNSDKSRLAVNAVTLGDFDAPLRISAFAKEVFTGFSMVRELLLHAYDVLIRMDPQLNLKNDPLRRRFDSLKYDIKKIEEGETSLSHSRISY